MSSPQQKSAWFDEALQTPIIAEKAKQAESFLAAMADGRIDDAEIEAQQCRVVALMKEIEPKLDASLHAKVTDLLCELTVFDFMQAVQSVQAARPKTVFQG